MKTQIQENNHGLNHTNHDCIHIFEDQFMSGAEKYTFISILAIIGILVTLANILLIHGLRNTNKKLSLSKKLFMYLSISDLCTGSITVPYQISMVIASSNASCFQVKLQSFLNVFTPGMAMFTILSISVARYLSVAKPGFFHKNANSPWVFVLMVVQAIMALGVAVWYTSATTQIQLGLFLVGVMFFCFSLIGVSILVNICLYKQLNKYTVENMAAKQKRNNEYQKEVAKTLMIISFTLSVCYLPNGVVFALVGYYVFTDDPNSVTYNTYIPWVHIPIVLNAALNSFVYMWRDRKIFGLYKKLLCTQRNNKEEGHLPQSIPSVNRRIRTILDKKTASSEMLDSIASYTV